MSARSTKIAVITVLIILVLTAGVTLYLNKRLSDQRRVEEDGQPVQLYKPNPVPRQETFTKTAFILPREENTSPDSSIYSKIAQVRGVVQYYSGDQVVVDVSGAPVYVTLTPQTELFCTPLEIDRGDGQMMSSKEVFVDLYRAKGKGRIVSPDVIAKTVPGGQDINIQVDVAGEDEFRASIVMGYGCSVPY